MSILMTVLMVVQVLSALGVIVLVLLQHGKGADMGAAFGSGASGSLFGASGSANFMSRTTGGLATVFFLRNVGHRDAFGSSRSRDRQRDGRRGSDDPRCGPGVCASCWVGRAGRWVRFDGRWAWCFRWRVAGRCSRSWWGLGERCGCNPRACNGSAPTLSCDRTTRSCPLRNWFTIRSS